MAAALDFLRSQQIAHGPVDVDDVRVRRNELRVITCVELIVPAGDSVPTVESDVANLGQFAAAIVASAPHYSAIAVAAASATERYPDCWTLAARLSAAVAPPPGNWPTPPATPRRSRGWLIAAALAAVVLVVAGGTVAGLLLTGGSSNDDGPSAADLPRQDLLLKNPDGVKVGSWTAVSMGTAPEWGVPTVCGLSDKKVYCRSPWSPVIGETSGESRNEFVRIKDVDDVTDLSGGYPVCIVTAGSAACWGGPPGVNGSGAENGKPGRIPGLRDVTKVAGGQTHACASDGHGVYCWGDPRYEDALAPVDTVHVTVGSGLTDVEAMAAGDHHLCAIAEQRLWCWGKDDEGQLGVGDNGRDFSDAPLPTVGLGRVQAVTAGGDNTCAVSDGRVYCWGGSVGCAGVRGHREELRLRATSRRRNARHRNHSRDGHRPQLRRRRRQGVLLGQQQQQPTRHRHCDQISHAGPGSGPDPGERGQCERTCVVRDQRRKPVLLGQCHRMRRQSVEAEV